MNFIELRLAAVLKCGVAGLLLFSGCAFAQTRSSVGQFFVSITLNGVAPVVIPAVPPPPTAGACVTQTLFNQIGAVVRVTCVDNPFVNIAPSIDTQLPGTFGSTFRYPLFSSSNSFNLATASVNSFNPVAGALNSASRSSPSADNSAQTTSSAQSPLGTSVTSRNFNSPTSTVTDLSIYRTAPQATTDAQGLMDMVISF